MSYDSCFKHDCVSRPCRPRSTARRADVLLASISPFYANDEHDNRDAQGKPLRISSPTWLTHRLTCVPRMQCSCTPPLSLRRASPLHSSIRSQVRFKHAPRRRIDTRTRASQSSSPENAPSRSRSVSTTPSRPRYSFKPRGLSPIPLAHGLNRTLFNRCGWHGNADAIGNVG